MGFRVRVTLSTTWLTTTTYHSYHGCIGGSAHRPTFQCLGSRGGEHATSDTGDSVKKLLPPYAYFRAKPFLIEDITMELLIFLDADVFTFLYGIDDRHNRVAHTIVSSTVCSVAQIQAIEELVKVGG